MKGKIIVLAALISLLVCGMPSISNAQEVETSNNMIEVEIERANIKLEMSSSNDVEIEYYGTGSDKIYNLITSKDGNNYKITINYIGAGISPTLDDGGVLIKIPDRDIDLLCINGKLGSGIVLDDINIDGNIITENCAVRISNKNSDNKINIDSYRDNYKIDSEPILDDFEFKAKQSFVVFTFANQPTNLKFQLNDSFCNTKLPLDWSSDFTIGLGQPKMSVDVCECVFQLFANN